MRSLDAQKKLPDFTSLPPEAQITAPAICGLLSISYSSLLRRVARGELPPPIKHGKHCTRWVWGQVRDALAAQTGAVS